MYTRVKKYGCRDGSVNAECKMTVGYQPISDQFTNLSTQNPAQSDYAADHFRATVNTVATTCVNITASLILFWMLWRKEPQWIQAATALHVYLNKEPESSHSTYTASSMQHFG